MGSKNQRKEKADAAIKTKIKPVKRKKGGEEEKEDINEFDFVLSLSFN